MPKKRRPDPVPRLASGPVEAVASKSAWARTDDGADDQIFVRRDPHKMTVLDMARLMHPVIHGVPYQVSRTGFHEKLASVLDKVITNEWTRVMIDAPPQHGKSQLFKYAICLALARNPRLRQIYGSYGQSLADEQSLEIRQIVYSDFFQQTFGIEPHESVGGVSNWKVEGNGGLRATGVGGGLTGRSGDLMWIDDPHKNRVEAQSDAINKQVRTWYTSTFKTRGQGEKTSICIVQTRWAEDDLSGWLLDTEKELPEDLKEGWIRIHLPALAEEDDILGREIGEPLYPEKYPERWLLKTQAFDPLEFEALYQGNPTMAGGDVFLTENFIPYNSYDEVPGGMIYDSWDTAQKDKESNDLTAWVRVLVDPNGIIWVLDFGWGKWKSPLIKAEMEKVFNSVGTFSRYEPDLVLIEDKASGIDLLQSIRLNNPERMPIRGVNPGKDDKLLRTTTLQGKVQALQVRYPKHHPRSAAWLAFFAGFPNARYKDPVDALSQLVNHVFRKPEKQKKVRTRSQSELD